MSSQLKQGSGRAAAGLVLALCGLGVFWWLWMGGIVAGGEAAPGGGALTGPGDCWGGALDGEPMACYVLRGAQRDGLVEVAGVFVAPNGPVYVMLAQVEPVDDATFRAFGEYYKEFILSPQWAEAYKLYRLCDEFDSLDTCVEEVYSKRPFAPTFGPINLFSPVTGTNDNVSLLTGGIEARQREPGWASWRQLWPDVGTGTDGAAAQGGGAGPKEAGEGVDVSDVDMVSDLADEDCESHYPVVTTGKCVTWRTYGHLGLVGMTSTSIYFPNMTPTRYFQIKSPPTDANEVEKLKLELVDDYDKERFVAGDLDIELIPVKYDLGELWRWAVILDRFKYSKSNTIGLTGAWLATNGVVLQRPQDIRVTINAKFMDHRVGRAGLPDVLAALGIPADAVGWVRQDLDYYPSDPQPDPGQAQDPVVDSPVAADGTSLGDGSVEDEIAGAVDASELPASDDAEEDVASASDAGEVQGDQQVATGVPSDEGHVAASGTDAHPQTADASQDSVGSVDESDSPTFASSSEAAQPGSTGTAESGGGLIWLLAGLVALAVVGAIGVGVRRARRT